ncbi:MAG: translation initiation factor IF-2 N-terminal domain-containing protein, partial [Planctomycetia bacterium]
MAVRIYSLAKELKIDSKELVELCARAGIQDKGSSLASMTDQEVAKLKEFLAGRSRPSERPAAKPAAPAATGALRREDYVAPTGAGGRGKPRQVSPPRRPPGPAAPTPAPVTPAAPAQAAAAGRPEP